MNTKEELSLSPLFLQGGLRKVPTVLTYSHQEAPDMSGVSHAAEGLPARDHKVDILGVGDEHKWPVPQLGVCEGEEVVVYGKETIPAVKRTQWDPYMYPSHCPFPSCLCSFLPHFFPLYSKFLPFTPPPKPFFLPLLSLSPSPTLPLHSSLN